MPTVTLFEVVSDLMTLRDAFVIFLMGFNTGGIITLMVIMGLTVRDAMRAERAAKAPKGNRIRPLK